MEKKRRNTLIAVAVIFVLALLWSTFFKKIEVETTKVRAGEVISTVVENGNVESEKVNNVFTEVQGKIKNVFVDEGSKVSKGQILAEFDTSEIDTQIKQLEGELKAAEGSSIASPSGDANLIKQQQYTVEQAKIALNYAKSEFKRVEKLYQEGAATSAELEKAKTEMITSQKALDKARSELESIKEQNGGTGLELEGQKISINAQIERLKLQKAKAIIRADNNGTVLEKRIQQGEYVNAGTLMFVLGDIDELNIVSYVNSNYMNEILTGDQVKVIIKLPGKDKEVYGRVIKISPSTVQRKSALGLDENDVKITVAIPNKPKGVKLIHGMDVDVVFTVQKVKNVLSVPKDTVYTDEGNHMVWIVKDGKALTRQVGIGVEGDSLTEIVSGLTKGDIVILNPHQNNLKQGISVKIKE